MAKKKKPTPKDPTQMQLDALAKRLRNGGRLNVFQECVGYNIDPDLGDRLFDLLKGMTNTFKCENCDEWMDLSHKASDMEAEMCEHCLDEIDNPDHPFNGGESGLD